MEKRANYGFEMPLHYPRYAKSDYEKMDEERLDLLLQQYGLNFGGDLEEKRRFAMGAFLWPDQGQEEFSSSCPRKSVRVY
ncbi:hypothetical protein SASPL_152666 [Salvia splendens]|uniref:DUF7722 domain-containing protein n=1 Tax=Salvia splendens TaxID=180675 RepID=A0A8X8Z0K3_SALSN|nr:hypothetical protein SASPL_152666 [Salvia splendens]